MISVFVKVDGELRRFETSLANNEAHDTVEILRADVKGTLPVNSRKHKVSPVFALIDSKPYEHEQLAFGF